MNILTDFNHSSLYIRTPNLSKIVKFAFFKDFSDFRSIGAGRTRDSPTPEKTKSENGCFWTNIFFNYLDEGAIKEQCNFW